jgi:hypothetical protein
MWTKASVAALLDANPLAVERAIVAIYNRQTADEQAAHVTKHNNNVGFSAFDAETGTYLAKWILSGKHLSGKYAERGHKLAKRYVRQLVEIANAKSQKSQKVEAA